MTAFNEIQGKRLTPFCYLTTYLYCLFTLSTEVMSVVTLFPIIRVLALNDRRGKGHKIAKNLSGNSRSSLNPSKTEILLKKEVKLCL
jgi:hypothetical protein